MRSFLKNFFFIVTAIIFLAGAKVFAMPEILPLEKVESGMSGVGYTIVDNSGNVEPFNVDIIGLMDNGKGAQKMIMAKASGSVIERTGGVLQGMSGSPIYVDGKLVGALAAGLKEMSPYTFFITPIETMLKLWDMPDDKAKNNYKKIITVEEPEDKKGKKAKKEKKEKKIPENPILAWIVTHKKTVIAIVIVLILLILFLVWALIFAPAVTITVGRRTAQSNFSENVTFTSKLEEEKASEGKFYLEKRKNENTIKRDFEATGTKNVGEYASGEVVVYAYFRGSGKIAINNGSAFTVNGLTFVSKDERSLSWSGKTVEECLNANQPSIITSGCLVSGRIPIVATAPGSKYNVSASQDWTTTAPVSVYSDVAMKGGTDKTIKVITQADVDKAVSTIKTADISVSKSNLIDSIKEEAEENNTIFIIENSFKQTVGDPVVTPKIGEEVKEGVKPSLTVTVTDAIFVIDETKVKEFITEKAKLANNYRIYQIGDEEKENGGLFIENFLKTDTGYTGKLKTTYISGPSVTENDIIEIVRGKGIGTAQHDLQEVDGISKITIDKSYPWVSTVPDDPEKITVIIEESDK